MEGEILNPGLRGRAVKAMAHIVVPSSYKIMKHPWHIVPGSQGTEMPPQGFIEGHAPRLPVLRLLQSDEAMDHVNTVPGQPQLN